MSIQPYPKENVGDFEVTMLNENTALLEYVGDVDGEITRVQLGTAIRNEHNLWPVMTGVGMRYYSNPFPCAVDSYMLKRLTESESMQHFGGKRTYEIRNGRVYCS